MISGALYSSDSSEWATPPELFEQYNARFGFVLDVCASASNTKCARFFGKECSGLDKDWSAHALGQGAAWMNPPYGREIGKWMAKAYAEAQKGLTIVCLVPARTDTKWFWTFVQPAVTEGGATIEFIRGRVKFVREDGHSGSAPFPSMVVIYNGGGR